MKPVRLCVVGAGDRGMAYSNYTTDYPQEAKLIAVAEPRKFYRNEMIAKYNIPSGNVFETWQQLAACEQKVADAVIIATPDKMHTAPALAFIDKGYDILLEKPLATNKQECQQITKAAIEKKIVFAVCHVLRYTPYTQKLKSLLDSELIGNVISIQHLEPVGYGHYAHSFVRGHWRNEKDSCFILLSKSCHDLDWIQHIVGSKISMVSSFGNLKYFKVANKPVGAGQRCVDCSVEMECPHSAIKLYLDRVKAGQVDWPVNTITSDVTVSGVQEAIQTGPYGRCVFDCDNDVVDHQVVNMEFQSGASGVFTMTAFAEKTARKTRIFGTKGELYGDGDTIVHYDFLSNNHETIGISVTDGSKQSGHWGGDYGLMKNFVEAVARRDPSIVISGPVESLETYLSVFAAEEARVKRCVIDIQNLSE